MPSAAPPSVEALQRARDDDECARAWESFLAEFSGLILHVIRRASGCDHDVVMDRYAFVLDALRRDRCRRVRTFLTTGRGKFSTWLVAVVRRLCVDEHRSRYGRPQAAGEATWVAERRHLADLIGDELALECLETQDMPPDDALLRKERRAVLHHALAKLAPTDRLILRLRFADDVSVPEIAALLGMESPFRLYRQIAKLLDRLRQELGEVGFKGLAS